MTNANNIEIFYHSIIYKLIDDVVLRLESMLAPMIELTVTGEEESYNSSTSRKNRK